MWLRTDSEPRRSALGRVSAEVDGIQPLRGFGDAVMGVRPASFAVSAAAATRSAFDGARLPLPCEGSIAEGGNLALLDANAEGGVSLEDSVFMLNYLFRDGPTHALGNRCRRIEGCPDNCLR